MKITTIAILSAIIILSMIIFIQSAQAVIVQTGNATSVGTGTAISITHGITINPRDLVLIFLHANFNVATQTLISDSNGVQNFNFSGANYDNPGSDAGGIDTSEYAIGYRIAKANEPATYNFTQTQSTAWSAAIRVFSGVANNNTFKVPINNASRNFSGATGTLAFTPNMSITTVGAMGILVGFTDSGTVTYSSPTGGYGQLVQPQGSLTQGSFIRAWNITQTNQSNFTLSATNDWAAYQFALEPAAPPTFSNRQPANNSNDASSKIQFNITISATGGSSSNITQLWTNSSNGAWKLNQTSNWTGGQYTFNITDFGTQKNIVWAIFANDSFGNGNFTQNFTFLPNFVSAACSCPASGNWNMNNCVGTAITSNCDMTGGKNAYCTTAGTIIMQARFLNFGNGQEVRTENGCELRCENGQCF